MSDRPRHWADDRYWTEALERYVNHPRRKTRKIRIDLAKVEAVIYSGDGPAYRLMEAMCSVKEQEGDDGYRGASRVALAFLQLLAELSDRAEGE